MHGFVLLVFCALRRGESQPQIVGRGQSRVQQADDGECDRAAIDGGREGIKLAEESAGEGYTD